MKTISLGNLGQFNNGVNFSSDKMGRGVPLVNVKDITESHRITISNLDLVEMNVRSTMEAKDGDLFFVRSSVKREGIGMVAELRDSNVKAIHCGFVIRFRPTSQEIVSDYLLYLLKSPKYREMVRNLSSGVSIINLSQNNLRTLPIAIYPLAVQHKIAAILSSYDDLIDTNHRRIQLLEESTRLLYREWFVYFRFPGHEKVKIVDGVPEGWEKGLLEDIAIVKKGRNITFELAIEGGIPVVGGGLEPTYYHNKANVSSPVITISASGANAGYVNIYDTDIWASDCSYIDKNSTKYIYSLYLKLKNFQTAIFGFQVGAAQPHVYPRDLNRLRLIKAPDDLCVQFEQLVTPIFNLIKNLKMQNKKLAQARDLLLPRLMSGAIEV